MNDEWIPLDQPQDLEDLAQQLVNKLDINIKMNAFARGDLKIEYVEGLDFTPAELEQLSKLIYKKIEESLRQHWYFRTRSWHPLYAHYEVFGDTDAPDVLLDNLEAFGANSRLNYIERRCFVLDGVEPLGMFYVHIVRWQVEEAEEAFKNYQKRLLWENKDFCEVLKKVLHNKEEGN